MIAPRATRLVRVPDLAAFRRALVRACVTPSAGPRFVLVPTRTAATQLRRTLDAFHPAGAPADSGPEAELVTRDELYDSLHARLPQPRAMLSAMERESLFQAAAAAARDEVRPKFRVRPGLVTEMLRFYDQLRRQSRSVGRFQELLEEALGGASDRGVDRLRQQTRFLARTFSLYEARIAESGAWDEHLLRAELERQETDPAPAHIVVTMPDWIADPHGLFIADFDLLARLPGIDALDLVATEQVLGSGFHQRLHQWWPEVVEETFDGGTGDPGAERPVLIAPEQDSDHPWFTYRDREEELVAAARGLALDPPASFDRSAIVFKRPLPYLYLARDTIGAAGIPYEAFDDLPLAAEPVAAALDLIIDAVETSFSRRALVGLLKSPHFTLGPEGTPVPLRSTSALDRVLSDRRYLGDLERLIAIADADPDADSDPGAKAYRHLRAAAGPALAAAVAAARELEPLGTPAPASVQIGRLRAFFADRGCLPDGTEAAGSRERVVRASVLETLDTLAAAHAAHHDPSWAIGDLAVAVKRWIGDRTIPPESAGAGVPLLDDHAAPYGEVDDLTIVGLVEHEWPERPHRNIFYPPALLSSLGWPSERDRSAADSARFLDLLGSPRRRVRLYTFTLEDEALVSGSLLLDEVRRARLLVSQEVPLPPVRVFAEEALALDPAGAVSLPGPIQDWAEWRVRQATDTPPYHGEAGPQPDRVWSVSALETYLGCPFKFFAQHVLKLTEEPDDEEVLDPRRQGLLIHKVFESFFVEWQAAGKGAVTAANLGEARALFSSVVERSLSDLPASEAALERTRLLGSPAAVGLGEYVLRMEAERDVPVVARLLEHSLGTEFEVETPEGARRVQLRGKADRIDLLADGSFRLIDYKTGWPPNKARVLQLPIYGMAAERSLAARSDGPWTLGEAAYIAFKGPRRVVPLFTPGDRDRVLADARQRLTDTVLHIVSGSFPPTPDDVYRCETCSYAAVCRKDYVGDV